jgi:hypothetical protein
MKTAVGPDLSSLEHALTRLVALDEVRSHGDVSERCNDNACVRLTTKLMCMCSPKGHLTVCNLALRRLNPVLHCELLWIVNELVHAVQVDIPVCLGLLLLVETFSV